jgi:hypothetical protein
MKSWEPSGKFFQMPACGPIFPLPVAALFLRTAQIALRDIS